MKKNVETETIRHSDESAVEAVSQILIKFLLSKNKNLKVSNDKNKLTVVLVCYEIKIYNFVHVCHLLSIYFIEHQNGRHITVENWLFWETACLLSP